MIIIKNKMIFTYKNKDYEVEIVKKNNKNTYIRIKDSKVYITTNYLTSVRSIRKILNDHSKSLYKMIDRYERLEKDKKLFFLFGKKYDVVCDDCMDNIRIHDNKIYVKDMKSLHRYLQNYVRDVYLQHLEYWYSVFEEPIPVPNLKIRKMKTRWGVCNTKNHNITLNFELYRYSIECLDYVIVHELSHFLEANHSKKFWKVVEKYYPNYKEIRKELRN